VTCHEKGVRAQALRIFFLCQLALALSAAVLLGCSGSTDPASDGNAISRNGVSATGESAGPGIGGGSAGAPGRRANSPGQGGAGWKLAWSDEFNEASCPDRSKWSFERGFKRNAELQWYEPDNAVCHKGVLVIEARRERRRNPNHTPDALNWKRFRPWANYTSASLISKRSFNHGRFVMRGRIDTEDGSWPAFWTMGGFANWPRTGEVDVMEYYRGSVMANICKPRRSWCYWSKVGQPLAMLGGDAWTHAFHVWAMQWDAQNIDLFLDGKRVHHFRVADAVGPGRWNPYMDTPQFLLLSQAIGGINGGNPRHTRFPLRFDVDYVRVYERRQSGFESTARPAP
jgi:beta-glucanase (GH16 family)